MGLVVNFIEDSEHLAANIGDWMTLGFVGGFVHGNVLVGLEIKFDESSAGTQAGLEVTLVVISLALREFEGLSGNGGFEKGMRHESAEERCLQ